MGGEKKTETQVVNQTSTPTATAEETAMNRLDLERRQGQQSGLMASDQAALNLSTAFLKGQELPGYFKNLPYGISPEVTQGIVNQSLKDINYQLAQSGSGTFMEGGAAQSIGTRTAGEIRQNAEEFNLGQLLNLLNLSIGSPAQIQQPINQAGATFSGRLAGLRSQNVSGTTTGTSIGMNPFLRSFQESAGKTLGTGGFGAMKFGA